LRSAGPRIAADRANHVPDFDFRKSKLETPKNGTKLGVSVVDSPRLGPTGKTQQLARRGFVEVW
jgi:hypothetical protein